MSEVAGGAEVAGDAALRFGARHLLGRMRTYLRPHRAQVWLIAILLLIDSGFSAALPLGLKFLVDYGIVPMDGGYVALVLGLIVVGTLLACVAAVRRDYLYAQVGSHVLNDIRLRMFDQLQRLSPEFFSRTRGGAVTARFTTDLAAVENVVTSVMPWAAMSALGIVCSVTVLFFLQWELALLTLTAAPLSLLGPHFLAPRAAAAGYRLKQEEARVGGAVQEALHAHAVVRVFGLQAPRRAAFAKRLESVFTESRRFGFLSGLVQRTPNLAVEIVHVGVLAAAAVMAFRGTLSVGSLISFDLIFRNFAGSVASLTEVAPTFLRAAAGMERIEELLDEAPRVVDPPAPQDLPRLARAIEFRNVSFGYVPGQPTLRDVSFEIRRGWSVAFVGRSGSGKSSVLNLLMRFHDPDDGSVTIDGTDVRSVRQSDLRERLAVVFQDALLFDATVKENILAGRPGATDAEVEAAARAAELHEFVAAMPQGYDTPVGERGGRLSGGQRQRLALARALIRDPEILLLDEATSALDGATEAAVERTLIAASRGRTVVSVTHRLTSVVHADRIFVLDEGRIVDAGTHDELLQRGGPYAELWAKQHGFRVSDDWAHVTVDAERLRRIPLLAQMEPALLADLAQRFVVESVPAGRTVIREGDTGDRFYLIVRGRVTVARQEASGADLVVATLETGDHFGEVALLRDIARTATIRTVVPCVFLTLQRAQFLDLVGRAPGLRERLEATADARTAAPGTGLDS